MIFYSPLIAHLHSFLKAVYNLRIIVMPLLMVMAVGTARYHFTEGRVWFDGF
jgi:hypothetical protein